MNNETILQRLRTFLLLLAIFMCIGTLVELSLINHLESVVQMIPFGLAIMGGAVALWVLVRPERLSLLVLRGVMVVVGLGSVFGIYEHVEHNLAFELEIRPNATAGDVFFEALGGASPLLAPGILGLAAVVALAATYYHPKLN